MKLPYHVARLATFRLVAATFHLSRIGLAKFLGSHVPCSYLPMFMVLPFYKLRGLEFFRVSGYEKDLQTETDLFHSLSSLRHLCSYYRCHRWHISVILKANGFMMLLSFSRLLRAGFSLSLSASLKIISSGIEDCKKCYSNTCAMKRCLHHGKSRSLLHWQIEGLRVWLQVGLEVKEVK